MLILFPLPTHRGGGGGFAPHAGEGPPSMPTTAQQKGRAFRSTMRAHTRVGLAIRPSATAQLGPFARYFMRDPNRFGDGALSLA